MQVGIYLLKVNNRSTRIRCEICSKLTLKTPERHHWRHADVFIVNFQHTSRLWDIHETHSELKLIWNFKPLWKLALFTWTFSLFCLPFFRTSHPEVILGKRCENMQQIYRRTPLLKCKATLLKSYFGVGVLL